MELIYLDEHTRSKLAAYLSAELQTSFSERTKLQDRIVQETKDYWAEPAQGGSDYPFQGSSSLIVPLAATTVEAYHARTMGTMFALDELLTVNTNDENTKLRGGLKKLFNHEFTHTLKFRDKIESPTLELEKHGTGIMAVGYRKTQKTAVIHQEGQDDLKIPVLVEDGTCIDGIQLTDFLMPMYAETVESAPWVGNLVRLTERDIQQWEGQGWFEEGTHERLVGYFRTSNASQNDKLTQVREDTDTEVVFPSEVEFCRIFTEFDTSDEGELKCIEVYYHEPSNTIASVVYNSDRPYEKGVFFPLEFRWYGIGLLKQIQLFQVEVTTIHRQRLDGNAIANMKMFKVKRAAQNFIKDDEPIFPGKMWWVDEPDDITTLDIGSVSPSSYNDENQIVIYAQQRSGINELTLGMPGVGTPGTASEGLARVQESTKKFDYSYNNVKEWHNKVIDRAVYSMCKYGVKDVNIYKYIPQGSEVESFLKLYAENPSKLLMHVQLAGSKNNKVLDRNTYTQLAGTQQQYWTNVITLAQMLQDPEILKNAVEKALESAATINKEILIAFDVPNPEDLIVSLDQLRGTSQGQAGLSNIAGPAHGEAGGNTTILAPGAGITAGSGPPQIDTGIFSGYSG